MPTDSTYVLSRADLNRWGLDPAKVQSDFDALGLTVYRVGQAMERPEDPQEVVDQGDALLDTLMGPDQDRMQRISRLTDEDLQLRAQEVDPIEARTPLAEDIVPSRQVDSTLLERVSLGNDSMKGQGDSSFTLRPLDRVRFQTDPTVGLGQAAKPPTMSTLDMAKEKLVEWLSPTDYEYVGEQAEKSFWSRITGSFRPDGMSPGFTRQADVAAGKDVAAADRAELKRRKGDALNRMGDDRAIATLLADLHTQNSSDADWMLPNAATIDREKMIEWAMAPEQSAMRDFIRGITLAEGVKRARMDGNSSGKLFLEDVVMSAAKGITHSHLDIADAVAMVRRSVTGKDDAFQAVGAARKRFEELDQLTPLADHTTMGGWVIDAAGFAAPMLESAAVDLAFGGSTTLVRRAASRLPGWLTRAGRMASTSPYWMARMTGGTYRDMIERGVGHDIAAPTSILAGWGTSKIEKLQRSQLGNGLGRTALGNVLDKFQREVIAKRPVQYILGALQESGEEAAQQALEAVAKNMGAAAENALRDTGVRIDSAREIGRQMSEAFKQTFGPMLIMGAPGQALGGAADAAMSAEERQQRFQEDMLAFYRLQMDAQQQADQRYREQVLDVDAAAKDVFDRDMETYTDAEGEEGVTITRDMSPAEVANKVKLRKETEARNRQRARGQRRAARANDAAQMESIAQAQAAQAGAEATVEPEAPPQVQPELQDAATPTTELPPYNADPRFSTEQQADLERREDPRTVDWRAAWADSPDAATREVAQDPLNDLSDEDLSWIAYSEPESEQGRKAWSIMEARDLKPEEIPEDIGGLRDVTPEEIKQQVAPVAEASPQAQEAVDEKAPSAQEYPGSNINKHRAAVNQAMTEQDIATLKKWHTRLYSAAFARFKEAERGYLRKDGNPRQNASEDRRDAYESSIGRLDSIARLKELIDAREAQVKEGTARKPKTRPKTGTKLDFDYNDMEWRDRYIEENGLDVDDIEHMEKLAAYDLEMLRKALDTTPSDADFEVSLFDAESGNPVTYDYRNDTFDNKWAVHLYKDKLRIKSSIYTRPDGVAIEGQVEVPPGEKAPARLKAGDRIWSATTPDGVRLVHDVTRAEAIAAAKQYSDETLDGNKDESADERRTRLIDEKIGEITARIIQRTEGTLDTPFGNPVGPVLENGRDLTHLGLLYFAKGINEFNKWRKEMMKLPRPAWTIKGGLKSLFNKVSRMYRAFGDNTVNHLRRKFWTPWGVLARKQANRLRDLHGSDFGLGAWIQRFDRGQDRKVSDTQSEVVERLTAKFVLEAAKLIDKMAPEDVKVLLRDMRDGNLKTEYHQKLRTLFDEFGALGVRRGWFKEQIENYVPRAYDPEAVAANRDLFVTRVGLHIAINDAGGLEEWMKLSEMDKAEAIQDGQDIAAAIADNIIAGNNGAARDYFSEPNIKGQKQPAATKHRVLNFIPDKELEPFLYKDPNYGLLLGLKQTVEFGEWRKRMEGFPAIIRRMKDAGVDPAKIEDVVDLGRAISGVYMQDRNVANSGELRRMMTALRATASISMMGLVTLASLPEWGMPFVRAATNNPVATMKHGISGIVGLTGGVVEKGLEQIGKILSGDPDYALSVSDTRQMSKELGVFVRGYIQDLVMNRDMGDIIPGSASDQVLRTYYKLTGLEYMTRAQRIMATATAMSFINHSLRKLAKAKPGSLAYKRHASLMEELGMTAENQQVLTEWAKGGFSNDGAGREIYKNMVLRFISETIMDPKREDKSMYANSRNPLVQAMTHLQGFNMAARNKILPRILAEAQRGNFGPAFAVMLPLGISAFTVFLRAMIRGDEWPPKDDKEKAKFWLDTVLRSGPMGTMTIPFDIAQGLAYRRGPSNAFSGAFYSFIAQAGLVSGYHSMALGAKLMGDDDAAAKYGRQAVKGEVKMIPVVRQVKPWQDAISEAINEFLGIRKRRRGTGSRSRSGGRSRGGRSGGGRR